MSTHLAPNITNFIAGLLTAIPLLAPLAMGSNRPISWMIWTATIALSTLVYFVVIKRKKQDTTQPLGELTVYLLGGAFVLFALLQTLPLGLELVLPRGLEISVQTVSLVPSATLLAALRVTGYGLLFLMVFETANTPRKISAMAWVIFVGMALHAVWSLIALNFLNDTTLWGTKTAYLGAATGTFVNKNSFATFLGMGFLLGLSLTLRLSNRHCQPDFQLKRALAWMGLALIAIALFSTQSRMGVASTLLASFCCLFRFRKVLTRKTLAILTLSGLILIAVLGQALMERSILGVYDGSARLNLWKQSLDLIALRPFLGFGLDAFAPAFELIHDPILPTDVRWMHPHNSYLTLWVEMGILAGSAPILLLSLIAFRLVGGSNNQVNPAPIPNAVLSILLLCAFHSLADFSLEIHANVLLLTFILALGLASKTHQSD